MCLQGFASGSTPINANERPRPAMSPMTQAGDIPWRSDEMLTLMDRAIEATERIAAAAGWPRIPPGRMLRVDDDDDRVVPLKRRLGMSGDCRPAPAISTAAASTSGWRSGARLQSSSGCA